MILNTKALGMAGGVVYGLKLLVLTLIAVFTGYGEKWLDLMSSLIPFYSVSFAGSLVGLIFGFLVGYIFFYLIAEIYNKMCVE